MRWIEVKARVMALGVGNFSVSVSGHPRAYHIFAWLLP